MEKKKKVVLCVIFKVKLSVGPKKGQNCCYTHKATWSKVVKSTSFIIFTERKSYLVW